MNKSLQCALASLRIGLGVLFVYAGVTKVADPAWTAAGYLNNAKSFPDIYAWFGNASNIGWINFTNEWGLTLIGVALILGFATRYAALGGIALMVLYYFPVLDFPYAGDHSFIVDEHVIYMLSLWTVAVGKAGMYWGLDGRRKNV